MRVWVTHVSKPIGRGRINGVYNAFYANIPNTQRHFNDTHESGP